MAKLDSEKLLLEALTLLGEVGLTGVTTRRLAQRLGVEQPALYWHFKSKAALLDAMAAVALRPHTKLPVPVPPTDWRGWFVDNMRSFRGTLLAHRDGALLHAGSRPRGRNADQIDGKVAFLVASGFTGDDAAMALLGAGRFTLGCVLEEQADREVASPEGVGNDQAMPDHLMAFEAGLDMMVEGLADRRQPGR